MAAKPNPTNLKVSSMNHDEELERLRRTFPSDPKLGDLLLSRDLPDTNKEILAYHLTTLWGAAPYPLWPDQDTRLVQEAAEMLNVARDIAGPFIGSSESLMRTSTEIVAELIVTANDPSVLAHPENWLWGPLGAPLRSDRSIDDSKDNVFALHSSAHGRTWNRKTEKYWVQHDDARCKAELEKATAVVEGTGQYVRQAREALDTVEELLSAGTQQSALPQQQWPAEMAVWGNEGWETTRTMRTCVKHMMDDAEATGVILALSDSESYEEHGVRMIAAVARPQVMRDWWEQHSPKPQGETTHEQGLSFWTQPANPVSFWDAVFLAAMLEAQYAATENTDTIVDFLCGK